MKIFKRILIVIGIILYANYIIHLPMCVNDYANKDFGIYSTQTMHKHSTLTMSTVLKLVSESTLKFYISPHKSDFIFDYTNNFYAIINIPVYLWQFARANINPCVLFHWICGKYDKNKCSNAYQTYTVVKFRLGGLLWITKKKLLNCWIKLKQKILLKEYINC